MAKKIMERLKWFFYKKKYCLMTKPKSVVDNIFRLGDTCACCNKII